ncbi:hypothetical protein N5D36_06165 [Pseudomonas mosselii]|uniref:hypothetical protein n=1 Tax=Pseudomonas mosselii TaxID=78327 RepID=UPI002447F6A5|nr:hypothetical protein [Pseudomonas mosselii]MDH0628521.1 hypothetical protein [Pseudomonas mosselii]MDH0677040.1 hypothetical protein [Pseudomonas mosselii]MDH0924454.1 hypothetical protein [Pseudomonas mosselii]MDH1137754.1 hypothetical protein [Pseudomonas mosselii]MDH1141715.1 hypothetical protein [Pseudomonas mosselii]
MKRVALVGALLLALSACADAELLSQANLSGQTVKLTDNAGQCVLDRGEQRLALDMPWPCGLSPDRAGKARVEQFDGVPIVLVTHVQPHPTLKGECLKTSRAVRLTPAGLEASTPTPSASCDTGFEDQKMFTGMFQW